MGKVIILPETTKNPITLIGERAGYCWGGDVSNPKKNYKRGLDCIKSNHGRAFEFVNIETVIAYKKDGVKHHFLDNYDL